MTMGLLGLYFRMNIILALSYLFFRTSEKFLRSAESVMKQTLLLRCAQIITLASLLVPVFFEILPGSAFPRLLPEIRPPTIEMEAVGNMLTGSKRKTQLISQQAKSELSSTNLSERFDPIGNLPIVLCLIVGVAIISRFGRLYFQRRKLVQILESATSMKRVGRVSIVISHENTVPFSTRVIGRAWVVLPEEILGKWMDAKLAIRHELQHHRQKDTLWAIVVEVLVSLFCLNPAIYSWKRRISEIQELSCDEALIGRKVSSYDYGSCLVRVAEAALGNRQMFAGTASMAAGSENPTYFKSFLRRRVEMLSEHTRPSNPFRVLFIGTMSLLMTLTAAYAAKEVAISKDTGPVNPGIVTTDPEIQKIADSAIEAGLKRHRASMGFVVVANPATGRILAVANKDTSKVKSARTSHWALSLRLGPASIAKAILAAEAVEKGKTTLSEVHNCENGAYNLGGRIYHDWKPFDKLSTADMIVHSSNNCAIKVGERLGAYGLATAFRDFGFGPEGTAEGFPEARVGQVPEPKNAEDVFFIGDHSNGQGSLYATPIEIVQAFGAIANGGNLLKPQVDVDDVAPKVIRRVLSKKNADEMKEVLAQVMVRGTAMNAGSKLYRMAGKTATGYGQTSARVEGKNLIANLAAFAGFAPVENPRVVILVGVENPSDKDGRAHGSYHAAPVFTEVAERTLQYLKVPTENSSR